MISAHPPKPRLTLRIGITGHRPNKLTAAAAARIERQLAEVFAAVTTTVDAILAGNIAAYQDRAPLIRLITGLAEGADQIALKVWPDTPDRPIEAILPFPRDEYLKDFAQSAAGDGRDAREEFLACLARTSAVTELPMPRQVDRNMGYVAAGGYLLRQIDLLLAVWDGEPPKPGGTGAVAREAREGGVPVLWLSTKDDRPPVFIERFDDGAAVASGGIWIEDLRAKALAPILAAPSSERLGRQRPPQESLLQYYQESWRPVCRMPVYDLLKRWTNRQRPFRFAIRAPPYEDFVADFERFIDHAPRAGSLQQRLREVLAPRYAWADALAVHFSHLYRSAYVLAYLLSAFAVLVALIGSYARTVDEKAVLVFVELVLISGIIFLVRHGRRHAWHERWLDYRMVAEALRHGRFLAYVSEFGAIYRSALPSQPWTLWYIRATLREIGLPSATLDGAYQQPLLRVTRDHEVKPQIEYHHSNAEAMHAIDHFLHRTGNFCFLFTFWMLIAFLAVYAAYLFATWPPTQALVDRYLPSAPMAGMLAAVLYGAKSGMVLIAAGLPAFGAALFGIRVQGDFERLRERSQHMVAALTACAQDIDAAIEKPPHLSQTAELLIETARVLSEDLAAWQELYGRKRLTLPA